METTSKSKIKNRNILKNVSKVINKSDIWYLEQSLVEEIETQKRMGLTILEKARIAKQELNDELNYQPLKLIFEILTNIPTSCSKVFWKFVKETNGIRIIFRQNIGTNIEEVLEGVATSEKIKTAKHFLNKAKKAGGLFGTGLSLIGFYTLELYFRTNGINYNFKTDEKTPYEIGDEVEIELLIPILSHKIKFIEDAKTLIEKTDFFIASNVRKHEFLVEGFNPTDNTNLSKPLQKETLIWKTSTGVAKETPDYDKITDVHGNPQSEVIISVTLARGKRGEETHNVKLKNFQIGKLKSVPACWKIVDINKPFLILISEETNQIVGIIPWVGSHSVSTNNSCIIAYVSKTDLRWLFGTADKMEGFHIIAESKFIDWMKSTLNKFYPDSNVLEAGGQFWARDIIVYDKIGKKSSNAFREEIGLAWMNDLSSSIRDKICKPEWCSGKGRFDLHIWIAKDGKINSSTQKIIIECKRKGFNTDDFNQLYSYIGQTAKCVGGIGLSIDIKPNHNTNFDAYSTSIQGSGQMSNDISFYLTDLLDYGFNNFVDEYTKIAMAEEKLAKEKQKLEESKK